jgi:hypothetical protein
MKKCEAIRDRLTGTNTSAVYPGEGEGRPYLSCAQITFGTRVRLFNFAHSRRAQTASE